MGAKAIKIKLIELGKKQKDLLFAIRAKGYPNLQQPQLNSFINGALTTPLADEVLTVAETVLTEWENAIRAVST